MTTEREEGWYWVKLPYFDGHVGGFCGGPWTCMAWEPSGWWFDEQSRYITDDDLFTVCESRIPDPDESWKTVPAKATREIEDAIGRARNLKACEIWEEALNAVK